MLSKKIFFLFTSLILVVSLCACGTESIAESTTNNEEKSSVADEVAVITEVSATDITEALTIILTEDELSTVTEYTTSSQSDELTKKNIVELYKKAAAKSEADVISKQDIYLKHISINNGQYEKVMDFVTPIMAKLLSNNSKETSGITGGYSQMTEADVHSAKAYSIGDNTAIELIMNTQVGGARDDMHAGPVGHAISMVGDIGVVTDQLKDLGLPMEISDENTSIHYTNPTVRVIIDKNGNIIKGTWSYTVDIMLSNYKVFGKPVDSTSVIMDNVITVNGGFSK